MYEIIKIKIECTTDNSTDTNHIVNIKKQYHKNNHNLTYGNDEFIACPHSSTCLRAQHVTHVYIYRKRLKKLYLLDGHLYEPAPFNAIDIGHTIFNLATMKTPCKYQSVSQILPSTCIEMCSYQQINKT